MAEQCMELAMLNYFVVKVYILGEVLHFLYGETDIIFVLCLRNLEYVILLPSQQ
jgi:hypothetical protein